MGSSHNPRARADFSIVLLNGLHAHPRRVFKAHTEQGRMPGRAELLSGLP